MTRRDWEIAINELFCLTVFFFQKKKQKALFCFAEGLLIQTLAKPFHNPRRLYHFSHSSSSFLLFPEKEAKSVVLLRRRFVDPKLGEAVSQPQKTISF
jgi:hypothetical protein